MGNFKSKLMILGIIFISFNLRAPITSVGSIIDSIKNDYLLTNSIAGFITTLPLLVFAIISPFVSKISSKIGYGITMFIGIIIIFLGELIRSYTNVAGLFIGTAIIGFGIAIGNVLIPSIIKSEFKEKVGVVTSIYTSSMCLFAAIGSGSSALFAKNFGLGWKNTLAIWTILAVVTLFLWVPQLKNRHQVKYTRSSDSIQNTISVWKSKIAWWVTLFMGIQSLIFYTLVAWLPTIITSKGMDLTFASNMALLFQLISIPSTLVVPILANKFEDQRKVVTIFVSTYLIALCILLFAKSSIILTLSVGLLGIGMGASISLSIMFISLRSPNSTVAADLSGMSQSAGYLLAAIGPMLIGFIIDITQVWNIPIMILIFLMVCLLICGLNTGKNVVISDNESIKDETFETI